MIESWSQWTNFVSTSMSDDLLLHVVPLHDNIHSAENSPCILFIKNLRQNQIYYYGFGHPDIKSFQPLNHQKVLDDLNAMKGIKWVIDKKSFMHMVPLQGLLDVGFAGYLRNNKVFEVSEFETFAHALIRKNFLGRPGFGKFVPLVKHLESFSELCETCEKIIKTAVVDDAFRKFNTLIIEPLAEIEKHGLTIDPTAFKEYFGNILINSGKVFTQYNVYTSTGRPSNRFGGINYAALNKNDGSRGVFISRFGSSGKLVLIDYSAFHPRIIAFLTHYDLKPEIDIYEYLAKLYFSKSVVDEADIADAKQITFRQLYGGVEEKYSHIKYFSHLKEFISYHWGFFNEHGYVETPIFKRKITNKHIQSPKPATVFNYLLQATEGELSIPILGNVNEYLRSKKTKTILYTYDSILFDYCLDDGPIMPEVKRLMSLDGKFPMKWYMGDNYHAMELLRYGE